jgi:hypothetical protein
MRYLSLLAAILASTPVCAAEFTDTIEIPPGFNARWQAPRPFAEVLIGHPDIVDAKPANSESENRALIINMNPKAKDGTNILVLDALGEQVANLRVNPAHSTSQYQGVRNPKTGTWQVYRKEDECFFACVTITRP